MNPMRVTPARSNMYQVVSSQPTDPPIHSDMSIAASTAMETFQSEIDDVKEDVQELKNGIQTIHKMLQQLITPTATVKTTVSTEPSGMTASTGGTHGPAGRYHIHHDKALVPIPSAGVLDLMRMNWPGGVINILGTLWGK
jgi:prophage DNA circulation protein